MIGILPEADDWSYKLPDGRLLCVGKSATDGVVNLNCVLQKDASTSGGSHTHYMIVNQHIDAHLSFELIGVDETFSNFIAESNEKLSEMNIKPAIPDDVFERLKWHFRWSLSYDISTGKIIFKP